MQDRAAKPASGHGISFAEAFGVWLKIGLLGFGGPAGQIALMHRILVEEKRWIGEERFLHALNYCMLLPGPEAQQLATYIGWVLHRTAGGLVAGTLFVLPGFFVILALSALYASFHELAVVNAIFFGVKAAVLAVVLEALERIAKRALKNAAMVAIALAAFVAIFFLAIPFPIVVIVAGLLGFAGERLNWQAFAVKPATAAAKLAAVDAVLADGVRPPHTIPSSARAIRVTAVCLVLWFAPVAVVAAAWGSDSVFTSISLFFSEMAVVTFGGAYAVLAYVAQQAVEAYGWLTAGEMLDGLGLAETTPGPLILVLEFVGYLAAFRNPAPLDPVTAGVLGAVLTVWVTFVPCFLWIFLGAPYIESLRGNKALSAALSAITAAVVGVILNLTIWFALHVLFHSVRDLRFGILRAPVPEWASFDLAALILAVAAVVAMFRFKAGMLPTLAGCALVGAVYKLALG
jgi:chromate transporter